MHTWLAPLMLEHLSPVFLSLLKFLWRFSEFERSPQLGQIHWNFMRRKIWVLVDCAKGVETVAIHAHVEPEAGGIPHGFFHVMVVPVEIRLLFHKVVIVILVAIRYVRPGIAVEAGLP